MEYINEKLNEFNKNISGKKVAIIGQLCMNKELETAQYATRNRDLRYQSVTNCTIGLMSLNFFDPPFLHLQNQRYSC